MLHFQAGREVVALNGLGQAYHVVLEETGKARCEGRIISEETVDTEASVAITVAQALPKTLEKLEWVLQHGTEVGASAFWVFTSARGRDDAQRLQKKTERWQEIARTAAEQSRRAICPPVEGIFSLKDILAKTGNFDLVLFAYELEQSVFLRQALSASIGTRILIIIGPEGGFTTNEVAEAQAAGAQSVTLGPRILRTETAALVMLSQIVYARE